MKQFTNLYQVSKTLRFELQPVGKTKENIEKGGLLEQDETLARNYLIVKGFIDEYHKQYIKDRLWNFELPLKSEGNHDSLEEYKTLYEVSQRNADQEEEFQEVKDNLRAIIAKRLTEKGSQFDRIDKKELIREDLLHFLTNEEDREIVSQFADFTSYFTGFHENRRNMYSSEEKSTAIAYRLIHQNLPKFMENMKAFAKIAQTPVAEHFIDIYTGWEEFLNVRSIEDMFRLEYFSQTLTQPHIEVYNYIIGKKIQEDGSEIKGINEYVNLYNQQQKDKKQRIPLLVPLYKQILSDREKLSWLADEFDSDAKMLTAISEIYAHLYDVLRGEETENLHSLITHLKDYNLSRIYVSNDLSLSDISQHIFGRYDVFSTGIKENLKTAYPQKNKENAEAYEERIGKLFKARKSFSLDELNNLPQPDMGDSKLRRLEDYFRTLGAVNSESVQKENLLAQIEIAYDEVLPVLQQSKNDNNLSQNKDAVAKIKKLLDALKDLQHFIKPLLGSGEENEKDELFYGLFQTIWDELDAVMPLYNKVRNWLTRKPYSTEKIKLNFENAQLLNGWDVNKEPDCTGVLLCKNGFYYLGIMNKKANHIFAYDSLTTNSDDSFEKIEYKLLPGANKMLPKVFFSKSRIDEFAPTPKIIENYKKGTHKKGSSFSLDDCHQLIEFFKDSISKHEDWSKFNFHFSDTDSYNDISEFYHEVEQQGYKLSTRPISATWINQMVEEGKLYLFRIWNKDFSEYSKGTPNLHTLYWKMLFDEKNLADVVYKLNGQAEIFFRKASINPKNRIVHPANQAIKNKNTLNEKQTSTFGYDIIKDRRYTVDKFQFHVPITINFKAAGQSNINPIVHETIRKNGFTHIIGIDRGERHLLYLSLIDLHGNIVKQMTLNEIINEYKGKKYVTNYHDLLAKREGERTDARRSWSTIETIKELKEGYLSQVVHIIARMMVEYNAIIVLEDLNMGFMRGRQKIERQVYEKFEKMLIEKLNCYIDKQADPEVEGGLLHPLQLTNEFKSFRKLGKQSGCLFYIPAWNTSKIDPVTGFVNLFDTRYETIGKSRSFFSSFKRIWFNSDKDWFEFSFDYNDFTAKAEGTRSQWTLCSYGTRIRNFRNPQKNNQWDNEEVVLTEQFKKLFAYYHIDVNSNLKEAIIGQTEAKFFQSLMGLMKLLLQMRNSKINSDVDYLLSPVADEDGRFFDSRSASESLPENADANGAFNIARKGLWVIRKIKNATASDEKLSLAVSNKEWLQFAQTKPYLND